MGDSYGAALAVRWKCVEPRVEKAIAISPYASLSNATLNIVHENAPWIPRFLIRSGLKHLPDVLNVPSAELDTTTVLARHPVQIFFATGEVDRIAPAAEVERLMELAAPGSVFHVIPTASHETAPYFFDDLLPQVRSWLGDEPVANK
jgi:cephalosporin-C deacetylase-like acetyl esterase